MAYNIPTKKSTWNVFHTLLICTCCYLSIWLVHRSAEIATDPQDEKIIRRKGDADAGSIPKLYYPIREKDYIDKVVYDIPKVGMITQILSPPVKYVLIGIVAIALMYTLSKQGRHDQFPKNKESK